MRAEPHIRSILLTTRFGEPSRIAAPIACMMAQIHGARIHVLHILPATKTTAMVSVGMGDVVSAELVNSTIRTARRRLHQFIQQHVARFCATVTDAVMVGTPICDQIASYARAHNIDLIVSGTHGHGMLHRFAFGSVSKAILQHAPCPVLLVPTVARPVMPAVTPELLTSEALLG